MEPAPVMSQGTILVGALLAMFVFYLIVNNRVAAYTAVIGL
jgi:hypothetical protein